MGYHKRPAYEKHAYLLVDQARFSGDYRGVNMTNKAEVIMMFRDSPGAGKDLTAPGEKVTQSCIVEIGMKR